LISSSSINVFQTLTLILFVANGVDPIVQVRIILLRSIPSALLEGFTLNLANSMLEDFNNTVFLEEDTLSATEIDPDAVNLTFTVVSVALPASSPSESSPRRPKS
jgi:hypothetical protein